MDLSRAAVATPQGIDAEGSSGTFYQADMVDTYSFTLLDESVLESTTVDDPDESSGATDQDSFVSVGMIDEWLDSFKRRPSVSQQVVDADNALLNLMHSGGPEQEEVLLVAEDNQQELRPWDLDGSTYRSAIAAGYAKTLGLGSDYVVFQAPCGLVQLTLANDHTAETIQCVFDVLDIEDM